MAFPCLANAVRFQTSGYLDPVLLHPPFQPGIAVTHVYREPPSSLSLSLSFVSALKARPVDFPGLFKESFSTRDNTEGGRGPSRDGRTMREESNRCQHFPLPRTTRATRFYPLEMALVKSVPPPPPPLLLFSTFPRFDSVRSRKDLSSKSNSEVRKIN